MSFPLEFELIAKGDISSTVNKAKTSVGQLTQEATKNAPAMTKAAQASDKTAQSMSKVQGGASKAAGGMKSFGSAIGGIATGLAATATGIVNMSRAYADLEDAQLGVNNAFKTQQVKLKSLEEAEQKLAKLRDDENATSQDIADAERDIGIARLAVTNATNNLGEAEEDQQRAYQDFYMNMIPTSLGIIGTLTTALTAMKTASIGGAGGFSQLSAGSKLLKVGLVALPLAAIAAAFIAIRTNMFGVRDALDQLGARIGAAIPGLVPFLNWIKDLGTALGLTGKALDLKAAFQLFVDGFKTAIDTIMTTDWATVIQNFVTALITAIQEFNWETFSKELIKAFIEGIEWTKKNVLPFLENMTKQLEKVVKDKKNWEKVWEKIVEGLQGAIKWTQENVAPFLEKAKTELVTWIKTTKWDEVGAAIITALQGAVVWTQENVGPMFANLVTSITAWVKAQDWSAVGQAIIDSVKTATFNLSVSMASKGIAAGLLPILQGGGIQTLFGEEGGKEQEQISVEDYFKNKDAILNKALGRGGGGGGTTSDQLSAMIDSALGPMGAGGGGGALDVAGVKAAQTAWSSFSTSMATYVNSISTNVTKLQTVFSGFSTSMSTYANSIKTNFITALTTLGTAFTTLGTTVTTAMTTLKTQIGLFVTNANIQMTAVGTTLTTLGTAFTTLGTTVTTAMTTLKTQIGLFVTNVNTQMTAVITQLTAVGTSFTTLGTTATTAITQIITQVGVFATTMKTQATEISKHTTSVSASFLAMSQSVASSISKMEKDIDSLIDKFDDMKKAADAAYKAAQRASGSSGGGGGSSSGGLTSRFAGVSRQHGFHGIVTGRQTMEVGEWNKPEEVLVRPLTNPNNLNDRTMAGGGGGGQPIILNITIPGNEIVNTIQLKKFIRNATGKNYSRLM